ncbi:hypothetical protein O6H91_Y286100 [Diphasiastrum complanatum]|nr:hypothetical protein O6H91_Y286100 [Diphasiastrum complanatum]
MELLGSSHLHCSLLPHLRYSPTAAAQQVALLSSFSRSCRSLAMPSSLPPLPPPLTTASTQRNPTIVFNAHSGGKPLRIIAEANAAAALVEDEAAPEDTRGIVSPKTSSSPIQVHTRVWKWQQHNIRYKCAGTDGPALILIHGFGANCDHWRKNIPVLARSHRVYAIDLLGYGFSDKPSPHDWPPNSLYTFETWARQILQFCAEVVKSRAFFICNSIGGNLLLCVNQI